MDGKAEVSPKLCPICGKNSLEVYKREGAIDLYRCGRGHYFLFSGIDEKEKPNQENYKEFPQNSLAR
jgi:hypothetical protein